MYKIVLIALKRFSFRITFIRVGLYFGPLLANNIKRVLSNKIAKTPYSGFMLFKSQLRKTVIEEQGRLVLG
jgi:hypothetical protein